jgi:hypothetical protein
VKSSPLWWDGSLGRGEENINFSDAAAERAASLLVTSYLINVLRERSSDLLTFDDLLIKLSSSEDSEDDLLRMIAQRFDSLALGREGIGKFLITASGQSWGPDKHDAAKDSIRIRLRAIWEAN